MDALNLSGDFDRAVGINGKPVFVKVVVVDPVTGEDMFWQQTGYLVGPGDVVRWEYPADGILVVAD